MSATASPYRNPTDEVAKHAERLLAKHRSVDEEKIGAIYRRRHARIGFGQVGTAVGLPALLCIALVDEYQLFFLLLAWAAAILGGLVSYFRAKHQYQRARNKSLGEQEDPYDLVIRLQDTTLASEANREALHLLSALELPSHRWPLVAGSLLLPLSLVSVFFALTGIRMSELNEVLHFAFLFTVHVHIFAALNAWYFPKKDNLVASVGFATLLGLLPFIISALVVAVVAMASIVVCHMPITRAVKRERAWIIAALAAKNTAEAANPL